MAGTSLNRRRNTQACIPCQRSKRKCSSGLPCTHCIRPRCESSCLYSHDRRRRQSERPSSLPRRPASLTGSESPTSPHARPDPQLSTSTPPTLEETQDLAHLQTNPDDSVPGETPESHIFGQPRLLKDSSGNDGMKHFYLSSPGLRSNSCCLSFHWKHRNDCISATCTKYRSTLDGALAVYRI